MRERARAATLVCCLQPVNQSAGHSFLFFLCRAPHAENGINERPIMNAASTPAGAAASNKQHMQEVMAELAKGNGKPFADSMADDFRWTIPGNTPWSRTYEGKQAVISELLQPLFAQFATRYTNTAHRIIAEGDMVVIECQGHVTTKAGKAYNNSYCYVCRMEGGQLKELMEYLDTALVSTALEAPPVAA